LRERILRELEADGTWFNAATRAEAWFGLGDYDKATEEIRQVATANKRAPWKLRTMAEQLAQLAYLRESRPLDVAPIRTFFETLLPGAADAIRSVFIGKVGLALSGGGFRASFFHLGVLACLAERDVMRHVDVLSCVSGGSIAGACYWLKLRERMLEPAPLTREDYVTLVCELMKHFKDTVQTDLRGHVQPYVATIVARFLEGEKGALVSAARLLQIRHSALYCLTVAIRSNSPPAPASSRPVGRAPVAEPVQHRLFEGEPEGPLKERS
jgi:hypothetical protein